MKPANRKAMAQIATIEDTANAELITSVLGEPKKNIERIGIGDELRKGGNGLAKFIDGQKEAPSGPVERRQIRKVFNQALTLLQQNEKSLTMADLQALVWYPEKRLYDSAKLSQAEQTTGYQDNEAPDYANAAVNLAQQLGVSDVDIQTTLQEVDFELERQAIERTRRSESGEGTGGVVQRDNIETDEGTGLPINPDGTVTVYHHTDRKSAEQIKSERKLRSSGEPDVYVTTRAIADTGYGNTAVAIRVDPSRLSLDDEFPNGRRDYRLSVGTLRGSIRVKVGEFAQDLAQQSKIFSQQQVPSSFDDARGGFDPKTLTAFLNTKSLLLFFSLIVFFFGAYLLLKNETKQIKSNITFAKKTFFGLISGIICAPMGITGAMMNVPILRYFGYPINVSIGCSSGIGFMISLFGATGFFISGFYLNADLPLSLGFVNIPAFLIFIPITTFMARLGANTVHNMNKVKAQRMFGVFLYIIGTIFLLRYFNI